MTPRLVDMMPEKSVNLRVLVLDPDDLILSKLERNTTKDRDDADYLFRSRKLDSATLRARYKEELRPYLVKEKWHDKTLDLWIEIFEAVPLDTCGHPDSVHRPRTFRCPATGRARRRPCDMESA